MNEVYCINVLTKKPFTLYFSNLLKQRRFLVKCRYSQKVMVVGYTYQSQEEYEYLAFGR